MNCCWFIHRLLVKPTVYVEIEYINITIDIYDYGQFLRNIDPKS